MSYRWREESHATAASESSNGTATFTISLVRRTLDRSNAITLLWVESDIQGVYTNPVVWRVPYATAPSAVQRTKVAALSDTLGLGGLHMVANRGVALNVVGYQQAVVTRLSDGVGWTLTPEPGTRFVHPIWIDDSEIWLLTASPDANGAFPNGILRIDRSTLGAPTLGRGF